MENQNQNPGSQELANGAPKEVHAQLERAAAIGRFCWKQRGKAFPGWSPVVFGQYVLFMVCKKCVAVNENAKGIQAVGFCWKDKRSEVEARAAAGEGLFKWRVDRPDADCIVVGEVVGAKKFLRPLWSFLQERFPESAVTGQQWPVVTMRGKALVELTPPTMERLLHGRRSSQST